MVGKYEYMCEILSIDKNIAHKFYHIYICLGPTDSNLIKTDISVLSFNNLNFIHTLLSIKRIVSL